MSWHSPARTSFPNSSRLPLPLLLANLRSNIRSQRKSSFGLRVCLFILLAFWLAYSPWVFSLDNYDTAMRIVAYTELIIMFRVSVGAFLLQNSLLSPIFYAHFLRFRYYQSQFTQRAVARVKAEVDKFVTRPGSPPVLLSVWQNAQMIINRWAGSLLVQQPPPQQQQPAAAGRR